MKMKKILALGAAAFLGAASLSSGVFAASLTPGQDPVHADRSGIWYCQRG